MKFTLLLILCACVALASCERVRRSNQASEDCTLREEEITCASDPGGHLKAYRNLCALRKYNWQMNSNFQPLPAGCSEAQKTTYRNYIKNHQTPKSVKFVSISA